jgi:hypothetical protein
MIGNLTMTTKKKSANNGGAHSASFNTGTPEILKNKFNGGKV